MAKLPQGRSGSNDATGGGVRPLQFASAKFLMRLTGGHCPMPHHEDKRPSFSAKPGRVPGTTVVACHCCTQPELLAHLRKLGYRLGPMKMAPPRKIKRPIYVAPDTSVAFRALTKAEIRMHGIIATGSNPTYNDLEAAGIHRQAIPGGIRVLQVLGFIGVKRSPRRKGCLQYEQNQYWLEGDWLQWQPSGASKEAMKAAVNRAKAVAKAARNGGEDISQPVPFDTSRSHRKTETDAPDLRVSEVRVRGTDSGTESYVVRSLASKSEHSDRLTLSMKRTSGGSDSGAAPPLDPMSATDAIRRERVLKPTPSRWTLAMIDRLGDDASGHTGADTGVAPSSQSQTTRSIWRPDSGHASDTSDAHAGVDDPPATDRERGEAPPSLWYNI